MSKQVAEFSKNEKPLRYSTCDAPGFYTSWGWLMSRLIQR
jgi:hypothetical protein